MSGIVFIISAPSGSGKTTLTNELRRLVPNLEFSISYTTRAPRGSEQNGREYFFVSRAEFQKMIARGEFLEQAQQAGRDLLLDIDVQGAAQIQKSIPEAVSVFILPPNYEELEWRLRNRGTDSDEVIDRRLDTARREIENYDKYDYILVNDRLDQSVDRLKAIVLWERARRSGRPLTDDDQALRKKAETCCLENMRARVQPILDSFRRARGQGQS